MAALCRVLCDCASGRIIFCLCGRVSTFERVQAPTRAGAMQADHWPPVIRGRGGAGEGGMFDV